MQLCTRHPIEGNAYCDSSGYYVRDSQRYSSGYYVRDSQSKQTPIARYSSGYYTVSSYVILGYLDKVDGGYLQETHNRSERLLCGILTIPTGYSTILVRPIYTMGPDGCLIHD